MCLATTTGRDGGFLGFWRRRSDITGRLPIGIGHVITGDDGKRKPELPASVKGSGLRIDGLAFPLEKRPHVSRRGRDHSWPSIIRDY